MDKPLHKDIGEQFSEEINLLNQQPRKHIWENIDKALDKKDAKNYKDKFARLKKRTLLLFLLLIGISTFSVIYFSTSRNENNNNSLATQKIKGLTNNNETRSTIISTQESSATNSSQQQITGNNIPVENSIKDAGRGLFVAKKLPIKKIGNATITNGTIAGEEAADNNEIEIITHNTPEKPADANIFDVPEKPKDTEKNPAQISESKKESLTLTANNHSPKTNNKKQQNNSKFTLTAFVAPDYSAYRLENDQINNHDNKTGIAKRERSDLSFAIGILLGYKIGNKITIQSGLTYSSSNISINPTKMYAEKDYAGTVKYRYNTSFGYGYLLPSFSTSPAVGDSLFANGANHTLHYINIPIIAKYKLGNKKITFLPGVGITFNFLTRAILTTDVEDRFNRETEYNTKLESIKKISASLLLTPEVQYQLSKNWSISVMPYFKYSLGAINKGNVVKTYPYTVGLGMGAVYKF